MPAIAGVGWLLTGGQDALGRLWGVGSFPGRVTASRAGPSVTIPFMPSESLVIRFLNGVGAVLGQPYRWE
jgi:hypothetical protein